MSDDLIADCLLAVECLAETNTFETGQAILKEAANRIEELEGQLQSVLDRETSILRYYDAKLDAAEAKLAKAVDALVSLEKQSSITSSRGAARGPHWTQLSISILNARTTLAELKGEKL